jgi:hypothetical protein
MPVADAAHAEHRRLYARKVRMKSFTTASLLRPETNVRLGTQ